MDFLNQREGGVVFYQVILLSPLQCTLTQCRNCKRLREFEELEILKAFQAVEVTLNSKEESS
jgi:hypothetical protein